MLINEYYDSKIHFGWHTFNIPLFLYIDSNDLYKGFESIIAAAIVSNNDDYIEHFYDSFKAIQRELNLYNPNHLTDITIIKYKQLDLLNTIKNKIGYAKNA